MSDKTKEIVAEFEYTKENGDNIHSDLDFDFDMKEKMRKPLHDCLDEWLDKSKGEGGFYLRNANHHFEDYFKLSEESQSQPKRSPLPNGLLPLTDEEIEEFRDLFFKKRDIKFVIYNAGAIEIEYRSQFGRHMARHIIYNALAIGWLYERFEFKEMGVGR